MKAIYTNREYGYDVYISGFPVGFPTDKISFEAYDDERNHFKINYCGKQKLPINLQDYDIEVEVKFKLIPKKKEVNIVEFK